MCIVQPSIYGTDNSVTLAGVKERGGIEMGCAVVELDPVNTSVDQMKEFHAAGARGVR